MDYLKDYIFAPIGVLVVIGFIIYQFLNREDQLQRGEKVGNELLDRYPQLEEEFAKFKAQHPHWSHQKLIAKFFTDERMEEILKWEDRRKALYDKVQNKLNKESTSK